MLAWLPGLIEEIPTAPVAATAAVAYLGVFPGAIAYLAWSFALARMPASVLSVSLYLSPVLAIAIAFLWIGEVPRLLVVAGGAVAIAGVMIVHRWGRPPAR
jgi:drug/metabolite transporter (DMT)-like permease